MRKEILISFCIPTFNRSSSVERCIKSMQKIKSDQIEIVVSDNYSEDNTEQTIRKLASKDKRIKYYKNKKNLGQSKNVVTVLKRAKGKYLYLTSDEDDVNPEFFNKNINIFNNDYSLILGSIFDKRLDKYYIKEKPQLKKPIHLKHLDRVAFRWYLSGIIFNKHYINFQKLLDYTQNKHNLYAYIPAILMCLNSESEVRIFSEIICLRCTLEKQYTDYSLQKIKLQYTDPISRLSQNKFFKKISKDLIKEDKLLNKIYSKLGKRASISTFHPIFREYPLQSQKKFKKYILSDPDLKKGFVMTYLYRLFFFEPLKRVYFLFFSKK